MRAYLFFLSELSELFELNILFIILIQKTFLNFLKIMLDIRFFDRYNELTNKEERKRRRKNTIERRRREINQKGRYRPPETERITQNDIK